MEVSTKEAWRPVVSFEGLYEISNKGNIRSVTRSVFHSGNGRGHLLIGKQLSARINNYGYVSTRLNKSGKTFTRFIHRLLAEAFIPNPENKKCVNHKDGNKLNNALDNLEWLSHQENMIHAYKNGLIKRKNTQTKNIQFKMINQCQIERSKVGLPEELKWLIALKRERTIQKKYIDKSSFQPQKS